ncbi:hypothetical protein VPH35_001537 [Triticum aestivum]
MYSVEDALTTDREGEEKEKPTPASEDAPKPSRPPPRRRLSPPPLHRRPATPNERQTSPATFSAGPHPPCTTPRLLDGLRQGRRRGEPQVRRSAGGDRGCHGQQGDGVLQRGGRLRARRGRRGPRRLRRAACAGPARRRRRAPQVHGAQDGAAQGRAQAARGVVVAPGRSLMSASRSEISSFGNKSWRSLF